jgi:hypothetical protein
MKDQLPCQIDPDRWFDRDTRQAAFNGCLSCPQLSWCADQALTLRPVTGVWAGLWIDDNIAALTPYLQVLAQDPSPENVRHFGRRTARPAPPLPPPAARQRRGVLNAPAGAHDESAAAALITARASGHCEILTPDCRFTLDAIVARNPTSGEPLRRASEGFATCSPCHQRLAALEPQLAHQLGYQIPAGTDPARVPFYWRQHHWRYFDDAGHAQPIDNTRRNQRTG